MFTGIIQSKGKVEHLEKFDTDLRLTFSLGKLQSQNIQLGDSIAVNGVCLTAVEIDNKKNTVVADVSHETLDVTLLGDLKTGVEVNLELALRAGDHLGGHLVSGHVDGIAELTEMYADGESVRLVFALKEKLKSLSLAKYIADKASVTIDGVSLTVNSVTDFAEDKVTQFGINIVPHTQQETIIGGYQTGQLVHVETDIIARYIQRSKECKFD